MVSMSPGKYRAPPSGDLPKKGKRILAAVYEKQRSRGYSKERSARMAWGAVHRAGLDPWEDPRFSTSFLARVEVLCMNREEIERLHRAGSISKTDYDTFWKRVDAQHLFEVAIYPKGADLLAYLKRSGHGGLSRVDPNYFAVRCGGANQRRDPLNVFFMW